MTQKELFEKFMAQVRENFAKAAAAKKAEEEAKAAEEVKAEEAPAVEEAPKKRGRKKKVEEEAAE